MTKNESIVVDDDPDQAQLMKSRCEKALRRKGEISFKTLAGEELKEEIRTLLKRRVQFARSPAEGDALGDSVFDKSPIVLIDYDLAPLFQDEALMTGEVLASLVRRFSTAGPIVSVNRFGGRKFNLSLSGEPRAWADLSVSHDDLEDSGLWTHTWGRYRPWTWPVLLELVGLFPKRVSYCHDHLDENIVDALQIPKAVAAIFPRRSADVLGDLGSVTLLSLTRSRQPPKDPKLPLEFSARIAASEVGRWLEQTVLPTQDVLVDAPHLVTLFPSLLTVERETVSSLNGLATLRGAPALPLDQKPIEASRFRLGFWLSRRVWWTDMVLSSSAVPEVLDPRRRRTLRHVFAEDTSGFHPPKDCTEFEAEGLFPTRWVRRPFGNKIPYEPSSRLAS